MRIKSYLKDWRILLMIFSIIIAVYLIGFSFQRGVVVNSINPDSPMAGKLEVGDTITLMNEQEIRNTQDFYAFDSYTGNLRYFHNGKLEIVYVDEPGLKVIVETKPLTNIKLGLDLVGGTRVLLEPKENVSEAEIQQMVVTLETRINTFGLREAKFQSIKDFSGESLIQIEMAGGSREEIENLLARQGKFEGKISRNITFGNGSQSITIGDSTFSISKLDDKIVVDGIERGVNDTFFLGNTETELASLTDDTATLLFLVYKGDDIQSVCIQEQPGICTSRVVRVEQGYEFTFQVFVSRQSAKKFADITSDMDTVFIGGQRYLEGDMILFLDDNPITDLNIVSELKGVELTSPSLTGFRPTQDEANQEKLTLQSILQSGSLPTGLNIIRSDQISPSLGSEFIRAAILAAIVAEIAVAIFIYSRYRKVKILIAMGVWSAAELVLTFGVASLINWTIDLASIAGLIAAIGTGTNDQIMMIDEILVGRTDERRFYTLKQRLRRAFFIIYGAAGTIIAAMIPLMFIGIGVMRGF